MNVRKALSKALGYLLLAPFIAILPIVLLLAIFTYDEGDLYHE